MVNGSHYSRFTQAGGIPYNDISVTTTGSKTEVTCSLSFLPKHSVIITLEEDDEVDVCVKSFYRLNGKRGGSVSELEIKCPRRVGGDTADLVGCRLAVDIHLIGYRKSGDSSFGLI